LVSYIDQKHTNWGYDWKTAQYICGNEVVEGNETCDDGVNNGTIGYCNSSCDGYVVAPTVSTGYISAGTTGMSE
jgi:hypothetical protein